VAQFLGHEEGWALAARQPLAQAGDKRRRHLRMALLIDRVRCPEAAVRRHVIHADLLGQLCHVRHKPPTCEQRAVVTDRVARRQPGHATCLDARFAKPQGASKVACGIAETCTRRARTLHTDGRRILWHVGWHGDEGVGGSCGVVGVQ
jgi:hypothetical protein